MQWEGVNLIVWKEVDDFTKANVARIRRPKPGMRLAWVWYFHSDVCVLFVFQCRVWFCGWCVSLSICLHFFWRWVGRYSRIPFSTWRAVPSTSHPSAQIISPSRYCDLTFWGRIPSCHHVHNVFTFKFHKLHYSLKGIEASIAGWVFARFKLRG